MDIDMNAENERRQFWRAGFKAPAQLVLRDGARDVELLNISLDGALIRLESEAALALHEPCQLRLELGEGDMAIVMETTVTHAGPERRIGLRRASIDFDSITRLRRLLELNAGDTGRTQHELLALSRA